MKKKAIFPVSKSFRRIFLDLSSVTNPKGQFLRVHKVFWQLLCKVKDNSVAPKRLLNTKFLKKMEWLQRKKNILAYFFSYYRTWQTSRSNLSGYKRIIEKYCASYMIISLGPKKSRTNFFKKSLSYRRKKFWRLFSRITHHGTHRVAFC